ncbi:MAG: reverse transcriptase domain-containing protein [Jaaginema sp. PMC 1079.18]|nr:reverse transcriptase domain-containing protein [Jaaginema sp. PMC 1080.18]MEC4849548.1 reverse transcriptase domain-containing protein [Jaaginema sp. PMC 1079.18]MEC4867902.1 reverse transcriptase domain-containing protein [Jaaginema sp. PMC 1078.18]
MSEQPRSRQELYDRVRQVGKEQFILEEMIRFGFWSEDDEVHQETTEEIQRRWQLQRELRDLRKQSRLLQDEKALRQQMLKERLAESRRKQQENKERREKERQERAAAWQAQKATEIAYLGEDVSGGLNHSQSNPQRLQTYGLPDFENALTLATRMNISIGELRFLAFNRKVAKVSHYIRFNIPKKTGGDRLISAPMPRLKAVQHWILAHILNEIEPHDAAHGFRRDRSILTNAQPHVNSEVVINCDLKDFFPTLNYKRIKGLFRAIGYSEAIATILGLLCTEADTETIELDDITYYVATGDRHLPQGSPTSPALTNILCRRLDRRLSALADELGYTYTRYADDLTFSASGDNLNHIRTLLHRSENIITHEGFTRHPDKLRIQRQKSRQQEVTGIVVNEFPNIDRKTLKRFRATLYQIECDGFTGKHWGRGDNLMAEIQGYTNFINLVNPDKGAKFQAQIQRIRQKWLSSPSTTSDIIVECYKKGSKLKVKVVSPGYNPDWNVRFPKDLRREGARYRVESIKEASRGGFYTVSGGITLLK